jgi:hypothetical protein
MMDSPQFFPIDSFSKVNSRHYKLFYNGSISLDIFIIDPKNEIAVFKYIGLHNEGEGDYNYELMINADKVKNFTIITHPDTGGKLRELHSDPIDFEKLVWGL